MHANYDNHDIYTKLAALPAWNSMNAYVRAKLACAELLRAGAPIPAWTAIREIIGKGSANDINRAKHDFRLEHAQTLRKMEGFSAEGVPPDLTPHILGLWQAAVAQAQETYAEQARAWQNQVEQAEIACRHAQTEMQHAQTAMQASQAQTQALAQTKLALQAQIHSEQAARAQAEKMVVDIRADLIAQRDRLEQALTQTQTEMEKAITRLEAAERRSMMEIERARQQAAQQVANIQARLKAEQENHAEESVRLNGKIQENQAGLARLREQYVVLEQENRALTDRARRAEALTGELQAQHAALHARHATVLAAIAQPGPHRQAPLKKKRLRRQTGPR